MRSNVYRSVGGRSLVLAGLVCLGLSMATNAAGQGKGGPKNNTQETHKRLFVTSQVYTGNLGGLAGADYKCQSLAAAAGLPGTYKAWLSTSKGQPNGRFNPSVLPYRLVDGTLVANDWQDLVTSKSDGFLRHPIDRDEFGQPLPPSAAWTATSNFGTANNTGTCNEWMTSAAAFDGIYGATNRTSTWSAAENLSCNYSARLFCFQQ